MKQIKLVLILLLSIGVVCVAQRQSSKEPSDNHAEMKQLESVTWDLKTHKLTWAVASGAVTNGKFEARSSQHYEISPNEAIMKFSDQQRGFSPQEAVAVQK